MNPLYNEISDVLHKRSKALHAATSDTIIPMRKRHLKEAAQLDDQLIDLLAQLNDNRPEHSSIIRLPDGSKRILQSLHGDVARYVPLDQAHSDEFAYEPTPRKERLANERSRSAEVLHTIIALEAVGVSAVTADEHTVSELRTFQ